jgi:hemerythrin-like metal-binding protein
MSESKTSDAAAPSWNILFVGSSLTDSVLADIAALKFHGRHFRPLQAATQELARREIAALPDLAVLIATDACAHDMARTLRNELKNWETSLALLGSTDTGSCEFDELMAYALCVSIAPQATASEMAQALIMATGSYERRVSTRRIAANVDELLTAQTLGEFARRALNSLADLPGVPCHRLFCLTDETRGMEFIIAGSGRFAHLRAQPVAELTLDTVKQRLHGLAAGGQPPGAGSWDAWQIPLPDAERIVLYLEADGADPLRIDQGLRRLFCKQIVATYDHIMVLGRVKRANKAAITALSDLAEYKDNETGEHVLRVARMTEEISWVLREQGKFREIITDDFLEQIGPASILHDVGKVAVPDRILLKPGKLDAHERRAIEMHTVRGGEILAKARHLSQETQYLALAAMVAAGHHEQFDGAGYPNGLIGDEIPLAARIVAVVDVFDALVSKRPYKEPWSSEQAFAYISQRAGTQFDPDVVAAFATVIERRNIVRLVEWGPLMSVGEEKLDADHIELIGLLNQLATAQAMGNRNIVEYVLDELLFYVSFHFGREEEHMATIGYPELESHRATHRRFAERISQVRWQFHRGLRAELSEELLRFLTEWLFEHIMGTDMAYRRFQENPSAAPA